MRRGDHAGALRCKEVTGARPEHRQALLRRQLPEAVSRRKNRAAVVADERGAEQQRRDPEVPHHPVGRRVPEEAFTGAQVEMQPEDPQMIDEHPGVTVDDPLRYSGCPRREEDPQRSRRRHGLGRERMALSPFATAEHVVPSRSRHRERRGLGPEVRYEECRLQRRQRRREGGHLGPTIVPLAVPPVTVGGDEHLRCELGEATHRAGRCEILRANRPDRADARRCEERHRGRRSVREVADHAIAAADPRRAQP